MDTRILLVGTKSAGMPKALSGEVIKMPTTVGTSHGTIYCVTSLQDFHICLVDLTHKKMFGLEKILWGFLDEFDDFFDAGGVLVLFSSSPKTYVGHIKHVRYEYKIISDEENPYSTYGWLPVGLRARDKQGQSVTFSKKTRMGNILDDRDFTWECVFDVEDPHAVVAQNPSRRAVGVEIPCSDGWLILLPAYKDKELSPGLLRRIIDVVKRDYIGETGPMISRPDWIGSHMLSGEEQAVEEFKAAKTRMERFESAKGLLYLHGKRLTASVRNILEELGYESRDTENEGRHDIEIEWKGSGGLLEVKGLKKHAGATDLRQLSDHYSQAREDAEEKDVKIDIKGIFVVNHYREKHPKKRGDPFTKEAIRIGERDEFCLMTATQLHHMYSDFLNDELTQKEIHEMVWRTKGLLDYPGGS